jgi:hypothetical protein
MTMRRESRTAGKMKISEIIAKGTSYSADEVGLLRSEVELSLAKNERSQDDILAARSKLIFPPAILENFFRSRERNEKISQLLQFLLAFLVRIPDKSECEKKLFNPIGQFRECIFFQVALLREEDVHQAVFNEVNLMDSPDGDNVWDYRRRVIEKNRELIKMLAACSDKGPGAVFTLCRVLEHLCLFWFDVRGGNMNRIRQSDVFIYRLARILQGRCQLAAPPKT